MNRFQGLKDIPVETIDHSSIEKSWEPPKPDAIQVTHKPIHRPPLSNPPLAAYPYVNQHPENEKTLRIVPGNRQYSQVASPTTTRRIAMLGDSNFHGIKENEMSNFVKQSKISKIAFSGATAENLLHYSGISLQSCPGSIIIHGGCNVVYGRNSNNKSADQIATELIQIGTKSRNRGVRHIFISSLLR